MAALDEVEIGLAISGLRRKLKEDTTLPHDVLGPMLSLIEIAHERITELLVDEEEDE